MRVVNFIDDGCMMGHSEREAEGLAAVVNSDLLASGFVPKVEKSEWLPNKL